MKDYLFADHDLEKEVRTSALKKSFAHGHVIMNPGDTIRYIPIVEKGALRITLSNSNGAEYFLYHIFPGETCALSLSCCMSQRVSEVKAVAEEDVDVLFIPVEKADEWMRFPEWKKFVSDTQSQRFTELLETISLIAFNKLDEQLWNYLLRKVQATGNRTLQITHQEIATELNSPREVITRLLHKLQAAKKIVLSRNKIEVISTM